MNITTLHRVRFPKTPGRDSKGRVEIKRRKSFILKGRERGA